ncbi:MAG: HK97 family phage prohead protease [Idiomarina sp.]|nr:HK97 family phage prohead protease [Idiomarina sp.]
MSNNIEKRIFQSSLELRSNEESGTSLIVGQASVFNVRSENLGGFREVIMPGAFDDVLADDVRCLLNHDGNFILGRTKSGTLRLSVDEEALNYEADAPDTQTIKDLVIAPLKRGDIDQSSFAFRVARDGDKWDEDEDGVLVRTVHRISKLFDVSPVTFPAYPDTKVSARSLEAYKEALAEHRQKIINQKGARERFLQLISC